MSKWRFTVSTQTDDVMWLGDYLSEYIQGLCDINEMNKELFNCLKTFCDNNYYTMLNDSTSLYKAINRFIGTSNSTEYNKREFIILKFLVWLNNCGIGYYEYEQ